MSWQQKRGAIAVIGAGTMGRGIAAVLARSGHSVIVIDTSAEQRKSGVLGARALIDDGARRGKYSANQALAAARLLRSSTSLAELETPLELIVEAVPENEPLKRRVLADAERYEPVVLASNTSGISIDKLASTLRRPERFLGLHFFNPVPVMPLVEVVVGQATSDVARQYALDLVSNMGKEAIVVRDVPGFATSRLGVLLGLEAIRMVEERVAAPADIDKAMVLGYRHPVGPLRLTDLVGLDVRLDIARNLQSVYGERFAPPQLLVHLVEEGKLGKKTGRGFYTWET